MGGKSAVLVVEDENIYLRSIDIALKGMCNVSCATVGEEALRLAVGPNPPDLILLDVCLPGMDGYEVCRRLKADPRSADIPVIFLSACVGVEAEAQGFAAGAVDYIRKPVSPIIVQARVQTHLMLRQARDSAEKAIRAKARFLAAASHDLRQPVQSLFLFHEALDMALRGHPARSLLAHTGCALDALQRLIEGLMTVSRLEAGAVVVARAPFALERLLAPLVMEYGARAHDAALRLRHVPCSAMVDSDATLLERVVRNLLENAIRYTEKGGILLGCRRHAGAVSICIADTGRGIPADQQEAIFEEFQRGAAQEGEATSGLGLGLAIVRLQCLLLGHPISLYSRPGHGSCFSVTVPLVQSSPQQ